MEYAVKTVPDRRHRPAVRRRGLAVAVAIGGLLLAGCQQTGSSAGGPASPSGSVTQTQEPARPAGIAMNVTNGASDVRPDTTVTVAATGGTIDSVSITAADGSAVPGQLSADKTAWTSTSKLNLETGYTVAGSAVNPEGKSTALAGSFTTLKPKDVETASITPTPDTGVVGIAMPVVVLFDAKPLDRVAAERALTITSTPAVEGSWRWISDKQVQYRPRDYWTPGTKVDVTANMSGVEFAGNIWGVDTAPVHFEVGRKQISTVDMAEHQMTVTQNDQVINTIPITTGKGTGKYATRNGIKVIITRESSHRMRAPGLQEDDPEYYDLNVRYAMRLTWSGEFVHAAPWSVGSQGRANVSHGCTGMSTKNAAWLMENSLIGDPVVYVNGVRELEKDNGWTGWNMSYDEWRTGSALYDPNAPAPAPTTASPSPSQTVAPATSPTATTGTATP